MSLSPSHAAEFLSIETGARFTRELAQAESAVVDPKHGYGSVSYKIGERSDREYLKRAISAFTDTLPERFGNSEGTYTITIVVKDGAGKELAKEPILSFQWKNQRVFFIIDKVVEQLLATQWSGTLVDRLLVAGSTQRYKIGVEVFQSNSRSMDFESLKKTSKLFSEGALASLLPLPATALGVISAVGDIVDLFYSGSRKITLVEFDEFIVMPTPQTYSVPVQFRDATDRPWTLPIKIALEASQSRYMSGPFDARNVRVGVLSEKNFSIVTAKGNAVMASLLELLRSSDAYPEVRALLDSIAAHKRFEGNVSAACGALYGAFGDHLSIYDARSLFWAFAKQNSPLVDVEQCLAGGRREELAQLGLML